MKTVTFATAEAARTMHDALQQAAARPAAPRRFPWQAQRDSQVASRVEHWATQLRLWLTRDRFPHTFHLWTKDDESAVQRGLQLLAADRRAGIAIEEIR